MIIIYIIKLDDIIILNIIVTNYNDNNFYNYYSIINKYIHYGDGSKLTRNN